MSTVQPVAELQTLIAAYQPAAARYIPEAAPFSTIFVDVTHGCNMECANCYIPNRVLPDFPADVMYALLRRLPRRVRVRLVGAEPTTRADLPELIRGVRTIGHLPVILTNGLKLGRRSYLKTLKKAGLRTLHLSLNGGLSDDLYAAIDGMPCAKRKLQALDNLAAEHMNVTVGMILVRHVNDAHFPEFVRFLLERPEVRDIHFRSVGAMGRHMSGAPYLLDELEDMLRRALDTRAPELRSIKAAGSSRDFILAKQRIQITQWPDLGSHERGRLTPDGFVEPMFESIISNDGNLY